MSAAKKAAALAVGALVSVAQTYRATRDWLTARSASPFR